MREHITTVFDEFVTTGAGLFSTSNEWNRHLGRYDQIAIACVIDNNTAGTFDLWIDHSPDGRLWIQRNDPAQASAHNNGTGDISWQAVAGNAALITTAPNIRMFSDACLGYSTTLTTTLSAIRGPLLPFVRLTMFSGVSGHVRVHCIGRGHAV